MASEDIKQQLTALSEALDYEEEGLDVVIDIWQKRSGKLKWDAYRLLKQRTEAKVKKALQDYNPWLHLKCLTTLQDDRVKALAISSDNRKIISGGRYIKIWNLITGELLETINPSVSIDYLAITPDVKKIIYRSTEYEDASYIYIQDLTTENTYNTVENYHISASLTISDDGNLFGCGNRIWELPTLSVFTDINGHPRRETKCLAIAKDKNIVVSGGNDNTVRIWDLETGKRKQILKHGAGVNCVAISPDGQTIVGGGKGKIVIIWDINNKTAKHILKDHSGWIYDVKISPNGQTLFSAGRDKTIKIWDIKTGELLNTLTGHSDWIYSLAISSDGNTLVSGSRDNTIKIWRT